MASLKVSKQEMQMLQDKLDGIEGAMRGEAINRILTAGAEACVTVWKDTIEKHRHVIEGKMRDSVAPGEIVINPDNAYVKIYPQGNRNNTISNQTLAHIISAGHGKKHVKSGDGFVDEIQNLCERPAHEAMLNELNKIISGE